MQTNLHPVMQQALTPFLDLHRSYHFDRDEKLRLEAMEEQRQLQQELAHRLNPYDLEPSLLNGKAFL